MKIGSFSCYERKRIAGKKKVKAFKDGFLITPSGKKYSSLIAKDIVFVSLDGKFDKREGIPSSEWKFHQDIYLNKKVDMLLF